MAGDEKGNLRIYRLEPSGTLFNLNQAHDDAISAMAWIESPTAPYHPQVVTASADGTAKVGSRPFANRVGPEYAAPSQLLVSLADEKDHDLLSMAFDHDGGARQLFLTYSTPSFVG
jgi:WD40 repeat protein